MGYFANGDMGSSYQAQYCDDCVNQEGCWVWLLHMAKNYEDCNKPESILHVLIPRVGEPGWNGKCVMFRLREAVPMEEGQLCTYCKSEEMELKHEPWCKRK